MERGPEHGDRARLCLATPAGLREMKLVTVPFAMSRVWRRESARHAVGLHPAKVKMNRRDAVGRVPRRCCRAAELQRRSVNLETGLGIPNRPALPEPVRRDGDPGVWTGPARWEQDSRSSVARTDAISDFASQIALSKSLSQGDPGQQNQTIVRPTLRLVPIQNKAKDAGRGHQKKEICATWEFGSVVRPLASQPINDITPRPSTA